MSRLLKLIVHLIVFLAIVCILALAVPPFVGISTIIIDDADKETNLPLGSVTYGQNIPGSEVSIGDSIVVQDRNQAYRYRVQEIDLDNSMFTVLDTSMASAEPKAITIRGEVTRVTITIGFIGYLLMAIRSKEGLIVIGLCILFLIVLFILAELWSKDQKAPEEEAEEMDGGAVHGETAFVEEEIETDEPKSARQLKKEARARQKAEVTRLKEEAKARRKEEKKRLKEAKKIARTGGFIEDMEPVETILGLDGASPAEQAADQAHEELKKEIEAATVYRQNTEAEKMPTTELPDLGKKPAQTEAAEQKNGEIPAAKEPASQNADAKHTDLENPQSEEPEKHEEAAARIAIPRYTAEELLKKAKAAGEAPKIIRDEEIGVTLLDYSSIIGAGESEEGE